ncbi:kinase-like protein [Panus rudis PR-1116 ss-1]|nr:kinase-like protein [Panus rudis PR-1116 ss-1]
MTTTRPRFIPPRLDEVESPEAYHPGGLHPIIIGDAFCNGRYRVIHKLGFGGSSTIWLARDQQRDKLVILKALRADISSAVPEDQFPDLLLPQRLQATFQGAASLFRIVEDHFKVEGPNGTHQIHIAPLAGPNVLAMSQAPGRAAGSRRLRSDLARSLAKDVAQAISYMHAIGLVHGDLTTANILFRVPESITTWSDDYVYALLEEPQTEEVRTSNGRIAPGPHVPHVLVGAIEDSVFTNASLLEERVIIIDFGQSFDIASPPMGYEPATMMHYIAPESRFESRVSLATDIWALGCALFEIRAGRPLFEPFFANDLDILRQTVETLGKLPDPWWSSFQGRNAWFEEDGEPKSGKARKTSIEALLREIGTRDDLAVGYEGPMIEKAGTRLDEEEVVLLGDLLGKMLRYRPEERIQIREVLEHPWFAYGT